MIVPPFPHDDVMVQPPETCPRQNFASFGADVDGRSRASPRTAPVSQRLTKAPDIIERLRAQVRAIERHPPTFETGEISFSARWTLGAEEADHRLEAGLSTSSLHEIKPAADFAGGAAAAAAAATGFALRLVVRRVVGLAAPQVGEARGETSANMIVWCRQAASAGEYGRLYGPGVAGLGLDPAKVLIVETRRTTDTLWAIEEALRSRTSVLVVGTLPSAGLNEARRLSLAAESFATPCLLVTGAREPETPAASSRWRIGLLPARAPARGDASRTGSSSSRSKNPDTFRIAAVVERWRAVRSSRREVKPFALEWCNETYRFRSLADVADRMLQDPTAGAAS